MPDDSTDTPAPPAAAQLAVHRGAGSWISEIRGYVWTPEDRLNIVDGEGKILAVLSGLSHTERALAALANAANELLTRADDATIGDIWAIRERLAINTAAAWKALRPDMSDWKVPLHVGDILPHCVVSSAELQYMPGVFTDAIAGAARFDPGGHSAYLTCVAAAVVDTLYGAGWITTARMSQTRTDGKAFDVHARLAYLEQGRAYTETRTEALAKWLIEHGGALADEPDVLAYALRTLQANRDEAAKLAIGLLELRPELGDPVSADDPNAGLDIADTALRLLAELSTENAALRAQVSALDSEAAAMHTAVNDMRSGPALRGSRVDDVAALAERAEIAEKLLATVAGLATSPALDQTMARLAGSWPAVAYDPHERPSEILAIRVAARRANLVPIPSPTVSPRAIRGCALPGTAQPPAPRQGDSSGG